MNFPKGFLWGVAAASFQNEGASFEDGKGPSIWDMMARWEGKIRSGDGPDPADDHYHRYREDVQIMREIGLKAYRLSIAWPRVLPEGIGAVNEKGLAFYDQLIDALLENHVEPWVSLYHWDYPYVLHLRGGWLNPDSPDWFAEYTTLVVDRLSDRVQYWETVNEPQVFIGAGYREGTNPPGLKLDNPEVLLVAHHTLLSHGRAVQVIRSQAKRKPLVGAVLVGFVAIPESGSPEDIQAAHNYMFTLTEKRFKNTWLMDPLYLGRYPEDGIRVHGSDMPKLRSGDMETIYQPLDYLGINLYTGEHVSASSEGGYEIVPAPVGSPLTASEWRVTPEIMYWGPRLFYERYKLPIFVTENGIDNHDWVYLDGKVHDPQRIDFLTRYLQELNRAIGDGVDVRGYFVWTFTDNFECILGYKPRMGLVHVDYATQKRILKDSAYWYRDVIASNGANLGNP
jgi:beta-glucosidase